MRVALYVRVSTEEQSREGYSIDAQRDRLTAYAISQDWDIVDYYVDEGYSAKNTERPDMQRLISDVKQKKIDVVLVHKLDRFTRSVKDLYTLLEDFSHYQCGFRSAQEQFDTTTPMGRAMMGMLGIFAQWEREIIAERVFVGMEQKTLSGKRNGSNPPMGYDLIDGNIVPNSEADFVRELFSLYQDGRGLPSVLKAIQPRRMNIRTLHYILQNPVYCGKARWNYRSQGKRTKKEIVTESTHEPLISEEEFDRVQQLFVDRHRSGKRATSDFAFSGILSCGRCGHPMVGASRMQKNHRYKFYRCSNRVNYNACDMPIIPERSINEEFLKQLSYSKKELTLMITVPDVPKAKDDSPRLRRELEAIQKRIRKWHDAYGDDLITTEELRGYMAEERQRERTIKEALEQTAASQQPSLTKSQIVDQIINIRETWNDIEDERAKKNFMNYLFTSMTINTDQKPRAGAKNRIPIQITWSVTHI